MGVKQATAFRPSNNNKWTAWFKGQPQPSVQSANAFIEWAYRVQLHAADVY